MNITLKVADAIKLVEKRKAKAIEDVGKRNATIDTDFALELKVLAAKLSKDVAALERIETTGKVPNKRPESYYEGWPSKRDKKVADTERYDSAIAILRVISDESVTINLSRDKSGIAKVLEEAIG